MQKKILWSYCLLLCLSACQRQEQNNTATQTAHSSSNTNSTAPTSSDRSLSTTASTDLPSSIASQSDAVVAALAKKDINTLSQYVHTTKGLRFSPYTHLNPKDRVLPAKDLMPATTDTEKYIWGEFDGSGEPIELSFGDYYKRFVFDKDYQSPKVKKTYNKNTNTGNSTNNVKTIFPDATTYEYYLDGSNPEYGGMDWGSLTLVWEKENDQWKLVAIVHGQWTI